MQVSALTIYPIKSTVGIAGAHFAVAPTGLAYDRHWVLVDANGVAITGRKHQQMLAFTTSLHSDHLQVTHRNGQSMSVPLSPEGNTPNPVQIFSSDTFGLEAKQEVSAWFSSILGVEAKLLAVDPSQPREVKAKHGGKTGDVVKFADMNPVLLISEASLQALNDRLEEPVSMRNFRPNIVIKGCEPYEEDTWQSIRIGDCTFAVAQPCERCVFTTIHPDTLEKNKQGEPLRTLNTYRKTPSGGVAFGVHLIPERTGTIRVGDAVKILR